MAELIASIAGQKRMACAFVILLATALLFAGKLTSDQWISFTEWVTSIFVAGHVAQTHIELKNANEAARIQNGASDQETT